MEDLYKVRRNIQDPYGVLYFEEVATLPGTLVAQTAYVIQNSESLKNEYFVDGEIVNLKVSDDEINEWLALPDATIETATLEGLKVCRSIIKLELTVKKTDSGAESEEYQDIEKMFKFYTAEIKDLESKICKTNSPTFQRYGRWADPTFVCEV